MPIRFKLLITFLAIAIIPLFFVSVLNFYKAKNSLVEATLNGLRTTAVAKKAEVLEYLNGKKGRTVDFASDGFIRDQAEFITQTTSSEEKIRASRLLNVHLGINKKPLDGEILEVRVLDLNGKIIGTSEGEHLLGLGQGNNQPYFLEGQKNTYIQDAGVFIQLGAEEFQEVVAIATPLKSRTSALAIGVLVNFYNLTNIHDVLLGIGSHQWGEPAGDEKTSRDIFLVNQQKLLLTPSRKVADYRPLQFKISTEPVSKGAQSSLQINKSWLDFKGNEVLGASALLQVEKDWKWILVIEQNKNEVLAPVGYLRDSALTTGGVTFFLVLILALFTAGSIAKPIQQVTQAADKIAKGESNVKINIAARDEIGELARHFNLMVEKRQQVEEELKIAKTKIGEEKTKCEMVLASIGDGMIVVNQDGKVMMANHEAQTMFDWNIRDLAGKTFVEVIPSEDEKGGFLPYEERIMSKALSRDTPVHAIGYFYRRDNTKFPAAVTTSPIIFEGKVIGAVGIFRDITKEKEVDKMKTDFISTVSHEIRTPLTTIREGISQALDGILGEISQTQKDVFAIVLDESDRLKRIIDNLLDISKIEAGRVELRRELVDIVDLVKAVASTFSLQAIDRGLGLKTQFSKPKIRIYTDRDRLIQVLANLVGNSLKFTQSPGCIEISVMDKDEKIECSVSDTGKGIPKEDLPRVFSKFQQFGRVHGPGEKGTGLGLSISKGIIELHKGKIWVDSELNKGTRITFQLPKYAPEELFREYVRAGLRKISKEKNSLSILVFNIRNSGMAQEENSSIADDLEMLLRDKIRCETDCVVGANNRILMLLVGVKKEDALVVSERSLDVFNRYLAQKALGAHIEITGAVINYPEDAKTDEELVSRIMHPASSTG